MKKLFCIVWLFASFYNVTKAQENQTSDIVIDLPLVVDDYSNEVFINDEELITWRKNWPQYEIAVFEDNDIQAIGKQPNTPVKLPVLLNAQDTLAILLNNKDTSNKFKLLIIINLNKTNNLQYYYKNLENNSPKNTFTSFAFTLNKQYHPFIIKSEKQSFDFIFINPFFAEETSKIIAFLSNKNSGKFQFRLTTGVQQGETTLRYKPDSAQHISSVYYEARIKSGIAFKLQALYKIKNIQLGAFLNYENLNYENNTRIIATLNPSGSVNMDYSGNGNWPEQLLHFGACIGYDFLVLNNFILSPTISAGCYTYTGISRPFDPSHKSNYKEYFKQKYSLNIGLSLMFPLYERLLLVAGGNFQTNHFDASSYFTDIQKESYQSRQEMLRIELGLCCKL